MVKSSWQFYNDFMIKDVAKEKKSILMAVDVNIVIEVFKSVKAVRIQIYSAQRRFQDESKRRLSNPKG